jgi:hypothetical protein
MVVGGGGGANGRIQTMRGLGNAPIAARSQGNDGGYGYILEPLIMAAGGGGGAGAVGGNGQQAQVLLAMEELVIVIQFQAQLSGN